MSANIFNESRNWLINAANIASPTGSTSVSGNLVVSQITGTNTNINNTLTFTGNLAIPLGTTNSYIAAGQLRYNPSLSAIQFYNGSAWIQLQ